VIPDIRKGQEKENPVFAERERSPRESLAYITEEGEIARSPGRGAEKGKC